MLTKVLAVMGIVFNAAGTVLLWRSSPAGYALSGYASQTLLSELAATNARSRRWQRTAIALITAGAALQLPTVVSD
jgi:hypothetical protein